MHNEQWAHEYSGMKWNFFVFTKTVKMIANKKNIIRFLCTARSFTSRTLNERGEKEGEREKRKLFYIYNIYKSKHTTANMFSVQFENVLSG